MAFTPRALEFSQPHPLRVLIPLFPDFNTFDVNGPVEVLSQANRNSGGRTHFDLYIASSTELTRSIEGVSIARDITFEEAMSDAGKWDIVLLPGGTQTAILEIAEGWKKGRDGPGLELMWFLDLYLDVKHGLTLTVCTGSLFLAAMGRLDGRTATSHWGALPTMKKLCTGSKSSHLLINNEINTSADISQTKVIRARYIDSNLEDRPRLITAGGVACGIDATFYLVEMIVGPELAGKVAAVMDYQRRGADIQDDGLSQ